MGQPEVPPPPGNNVPLIEGLGPEWNDIVSAIPEDQRATVAPLLKERVTSYESLKPWEDFSKQGLTPDTIKTALDVYNVIERDPRTVYEAIGNHLGITPQQAQQQVQQMQEEIDEGEEDDPRIQKLQAQVDTLAQIALAKQQQEQQSQAQAEADKQIAAEIEAAQKKYGDIPEEQLLMRMAQLNMTAEQAAQDYIKFVEGIQARRPAPWVMGSSGNAIPGKQFDPTKLTRDQTQDAVALMMQQAAIEAKK